MLTDTLADCRAEVAIRGGVHCESLEDEKTVWECACVRAVYVHGLPHTSVRSGLRVKRWGGVSRVKNSVPRVLATAKVIRH